MSTAHGFVCKQLCVSLCCLRLGFFCQCQSGASWHFFTGLPTLSTLYDCAPRVLAPLNTEPLFLLHFFPVVPGSCFGLWQPTWSHRLIRPPFGQRSSRGIWRQNEDNCLRWCQWKRRQRCLSSSSRSLRWCRLLKGLGWGQLLGGGGVHGPCPAPAAFLWHCALQKIHRVVSRQLTP